MQKKQNKKQGERLIALLPYLITFASGIFMGLTVAPVGAWFLAWIALVPLWVLIVTSAKGKNQFPPAFLWGIGYHGVALSWITGIHPMTWLGVPWLPSLAITLFCWGFISVLGGVFLAIWAAVMVRLAGQKPWLRILIGTAVWCGLESLWSAGPLWWSSLAYTQSPHNLVIVHLGQLSGPNTVTAAIVAVNGLIAEGWMNRRGTEGAERISSVSSAPLRFVNKYLATAAGLLIALHLIGFILYSRPIAQPPEAALKVGIIQGNIPNRLLRSSEGFRRAQENYTNGYLTLANQGVDAVLTPEGALPIFQRNLLETALVAAVKEKGVVAWIGAFGERGDSYTISLFTFNPKGEIVSRYDKSKLVPLGEYIPFEGILGGLVQRLSPLDAHQVAGSANQLFDTPFGRAIASICYESAFPEQFRRQAAAGGQFILSSSNDAHYTASMPFQHHAQDIMRAIESDRWSARATNTGYSAFVDPHGKTLWMSGYNTYETHAETIYRRQTQTLYVRWGDWLTPLLLISSGGAWLVIRGIKKFSNVGNP
ncbi:apolipoprotein N-acyltransferase [Nostoc sp. 'Peltigera membranacea cyanobiont' 210A]|uniref:apolipoprotein N-acyltransferase n=1 Tax=Nostoc sp. 'Peltigera membranacea cyanobiont' 210A TaxID=2014529 RepID=UPI000B95A48B|nr:apolipoprotein N-acyltransferase [Nostoc sp. 'Peltigera membranacea cyanobiont' 210A]OYD92400.1 apolipoprotein N-acyltransferase [Nostoc sp. 'Peltigera membranacea cyanobiont' 210A]